MRALGRSRVALPRAATALVVAALTTVASLQLLFRAGSESFDSAKPPSEAGTAVSENFVPSDLVEPAPPGIIVSLTLDRTFSAGYYLRKAGLPLREAIKWERRYRRVAHTRWFRRHHPLTLYKDPETGELRGFRYGLDRRRAIVERRLGLGIIKTSIAPIEYLSRPVMVSFSLRDGLSRTARRHGVPRAIIRTLYEAFGGTRRLSRSAPDATLQLLYGEKISRDGRYTITGNLEAARLRLGSKTLSAFAFRDSHGRSHLYDAKGRALGPQSLRFPIRFSHISSRFSFHRWHPILGIYRPHYGVDLAARYGTPVRAVADGRVISAGWQRELGRCVRISHGNGLVSIYGHLSRISPGVRRGRYVSVGQVIGRVGSSGLSTGSHLHFGLKRWRRYLNPVRHMVHSHHEVSPRMMPVFEEVKRHYEAELARLPLDGGRIQAVGRPEPTSTDLSGALRISLTSRSPDPARLRSTEARPGRRSGRKSHIIRTASLPSAG